MSATLKEPIRNKFLSKPLYETNCETRTAGFWICFHNGTDITVDSKHFCTLNNGFFNRSYILFLGRIHFCRSSAFHKRFCKSTLHCRILFNVYVSRYSTSNYYNYIALIQGDIKGVEIQEQLTYMPLRNANPGGI